MDLTVDLTGLVERCSVALLRATPTAITYSDRVDFKRNKLPRALTSSPINIYALWVKPNSAADWELRYIGQRRSTKGWTRVREHVFYVNSRTQSQLANVRKAISDGYEVGVTGILVQPDCLRLAVEEELIAASTSVDLWNQKARRPAR